MLEPLQFVVPSQGSFSKIVDFYFHGGDDNHGRSLVDYHEFDYYGLERNHDYIQWMFPLNEVSAFNPGAPIITQEDLEYADTVSLQNLNASLDLFVDFLVNPFVRERIWECKSNHNHLRISRIIKCLRLFGLDDRAANFYGFAMIMFKKHKTSVSPSYWKEALTKELW